MVTLKFGVFLYKPEPVEGVDYNFYRIKPESGTVGEPNPKMYTNIACFGDNALAAKRPEWISVSKDGPAFRTNKRYNLRWDVLCMTNPEVREYNLNLIEKCAKETPGISISSQHFADHGFCVCPRCVEQWRQSGLNWTEWRATTVTEFLKEVRQRVGSKPLFVNLLPDPVLGKERFGYDYDALAEYADYFVIPMFSKAYPTPWYWEMLARAFKSKLKKPVFVNFYVRGPGETWETVAPTKQILTVATRAARTGIDGIIFLAEKADWIREFQKVAVQSKDVLAELEGYGGDEVLRLVHSWESLF
ncbi:hypothetical protein G4O51_08630 [Candidatus Bathyarchaeota archaeon A05DMB-2]|nr:hypothetical protein [Candidatus Bathyarchaeota archaeon A05DMB-2]